MWYRYTPNLRSTFWLCGATSIYVLRETDVRTAVYSSSTYFRGKNRFPANYWYHGIADFTLFPAVVRQKYREMRLHGRVVDGYGEVK